MAGVVSPAVAAAIAASRAANGVNVDVHAFTYEDEIELYDACVECVNAEDETWTAYSNPAERWCVTLRGDGDPR
jgi:hypothetical protein